MLVVVYIICLADCRIHVSGVYPPLGPVAVSDPVAGRCRPDELLLPDGRGSPVCASIEDMARASCPDRVHDHRVDPIWRLVKPYRNRVTTPGAAAAVERGCLDIGTGVVPLSRHVHRHHRTHGLADPPAPRAVDPGSDRVVSILCIDVRRGRLVIDVLTPKRTRRVVDGYVLDGLGDDEVAVTPAARRVLRRSRERCGVYDAAVSGRHRSVAWSYGDAAGSEVRLDELSCDPEGRAWLGYATDLRRRGAA